MDQAKALSLMDGDLAMMRRMNYRFLARVTPLMQDLRMAVEMYNIENIQTKAHMLQGCSGYIAAAPLCNAARDLSEAADPNNQAGVESLWQNVQSEFIRVQM